MVDPTTRWGDESETDWYCCVNREKCGHIGAHPRGNQESCPNCNGNLERYTDVLFVCSECGTEYVGEGDAQDCCQ